VPVQPLRLIREVASVLSIEPWDNGETKVSRETRSRHVIASRQELAEWLGSNQTLANDWSDLAADLKRSVRALLLL
jgi:hypothetical protein